MRKSFIFLVLLLIFLLQKTHCQTWNYGTPFDTAAPSAVFKNVENKIPLNFMLDSLKFPYPTNSWFKNLFWSSGPGYYDSLTGKNPVCTYPYAIGFSPLALPGGGISYVNMHRRLGFGYSPYTPDIHIEGVPGTNSITFSTDYHMIYGALGESGVPDIVSLVPFIKKYDDLSVTIKWRSGNPAVYMEAPLVKGMPYVTMFYSGIRPYVASSARELHAVAVDGGNLVVLQDPGPNTFTGKKFLLQFNGPGGSLYWIVYSSTEVTLKAYMNYSHTDHTSPLQGSLFLTGAFSGYMRTAYAGSCVVPGGAFPPYCDTANMTLKTAMLDKYSKFCPVGGIFSASKEEGSTDIGLKYEWQTNTPGIDSLLMLSLPHHSQVLNEGTDLDTILNQYKVIIGRMKGIRGKTWNMTEKSIPYTWESNVKNLSVLKDTTYRAELFQILKGDKDTIVGSGALKRCYANGISNSTYFGGKELAKWGRLAVIADELSQWYPAGETAKAIRDTLKLNISPWFDGRRNLSYYKSWAVDSLLYDTRYGGIINSVDYTQQGSDFQNSVYTDHHFHYGYFLYAAAALAKEDTAWGSAYKKRILLLARDIANPSGQDKYFAHHRMTDWFDFHSWAQGLDEAGASGNNQESTSEAVNAWYGIYLLGVALNDENLKNTGLLHLACEIRAAQKYWQADASSEYDKAYTSLYKVVGNLYECSINSLVAFGSAGDPRMVYGIQQIPTTPVNYSLLRRAWCDTIYNFYYRHAEMYTNPPAYTAGDPTFAWAGINLASVAVSQAGTAYNYYRKYLKNYIYYSSDSTRKIDNYDDGQSKTNLLYNIIVNSPTVLLPTGANFNVDVTVLGQDTLGECNGSAQALITGLESGEPPYYGYLFGPDGETTFDPGSTIQLTGLCAGNYHMKVIDQRMNSGTADFTIGYPQGIAGQDKAFLKITPNPTHTGIIRIEWKGISSAPTALNIYNSEGGKIFGSVLKEDGTSGTLDISHLPSGIYFVALHCSDGSVVRSRLVYLKP